MILRYFLERFARILAVGWIDVVIPIGEVGVVRYILAHKAGND